jgi:transaldolase
MKIFLDTASVEDIKKYVDTGLIDGVTTNPSLLSKEGGDPKKRVLEICALLPEGDISIEVTKTVPQEVYKQAREIAVLSANVIVKIPCHRDYFPVINKLVQEEIPLNITLVFSELQALMMNKLGVVYISPFIGRLDDNGVDGIDVVSKMCSMRDTYDFDTQILAASLRSMHHVQQAIALGVDAITVPIALFEQACMHPLTDQGMATFNADWQKLGVTQFP